jgi:hypothetical protein
VVGSVGVVEDREPIDGKALDLLLEVVHVRHHLGASEHVDQVVGFLFIQMDGDRHEVGILRWANEDVPAARATVNHTDSLVFGGDEVVSDPVAGQFGLFDLCYFDLLL